MPTIEPSYNPETEPFAVDLSRDLGPATQRASGFLWGLTAQEPDDSLLAPLKPRTFRSRATPWRKETGLPGLARMAALGARLQVVLSDEYALRFPKPEPGRIKNNDNFGYYNITRWPGDDGDFGLWEEVIRETYARVSEAGLQADWDVWEEPNFKGWWNSSREQFFQTWKRAYRLIKELNPEAKLVGPSLNCYQRDYLEAFLLFAKTHEVLPDVLSWHEILGAESPAQIEDHVAEIRAFMKGEAIDIDAIDINEFISHERMTDPGMHVWYFAFLERAGIRGACKAAWLEPTRIFNAACPTLGGLLTHPEQKPRATWWVFRAYAELTGRLVGTNHNRFLAGLAAVDADAQKLRLLLGRSGQPWKHPSICIRNLHHWPWLGETGAVRCVARRIPVSGWNALLAPLTKETQLAVNSDQLTIDLPDLDRDEAITLELSPDAFKPS